MVWLWIWLGVVVLALVVEFLTAEMISVWFAASGIVALIMSACGVQEWINIVVFAIISLILILSFRKLALKYLLKKDTAKTNVDAIVGTKLKLLSAIKGSEMGTVKINGVIWNAKTENDDVNIAENTYVTVVKVSGTKVIVEPADNENSDALDTESEKPKKETKSKSKKKEG